jgi:hypothetical protein
MSAMKPDSKAQFALFVICVTSLFAQTAPLKEPEELVRLRQAYNQKRADAVKPIDASYRQQLEMLVRSMTSRNQLDAAILVRKEIAKLTEAESDEAPFKRALLQSKWTWIGSDGAKDVVMTFHSDGTVSHRAMHANWKITGSREVTILDPAGDLVLRFDEALNNYKRIGVDSLHGSRLP